MLDHYTWAALNVPNNVSGADWTGRGPPENNVREDKVAERRGPTEHCMHQKGQGPTAKFPVFPPACTPCNVLCMSLLHYSSRHCNLYVTLGICSLEGTLAQLITLPPQFWGITTDRLGCPPNTMSPLPRPTPTPNVNSIR